MKKLTKIGASALAGSLVAMSAQAGELSVSGTWELTHKSDDNTSVANPYGSKSAMSFTGSGDVDGLGTATWFATINDNSPAGYLSHEISLDMGDAGKVGFDQGVGTYGASTIDDKSPTAWEESWHNTANSSGGLVHTGGSGGVLGYSNSAGGFDFSIEYAPALTTTDNGDGAGGGDNTSMANGSNTNFAINNSSLIDGLAFGFGWTPCIGPILGSILALAAIEETLVKAIFLLISYSLGLAIPFVLSGYLIQRFLIFSKNFKKNINIISKTGGVVLLITGILILTNKLQALGFYILNILPFLQNFG